MTERFRPVTRRSGECAADGDASPVGVSEWRHEVGGGTDSVCAVGGLRTLRRDRRGELRTACAAPAICTLAAGIGAVDLGPAGTMRSGDTGAADRAAPHVACPGRMLELFGTLANRWESISPEEGDRAGRTSSGRVHDRNIRSHGHRDEVMAVQRRSSMRGQQRLRDRAQPGPSRIVSRRAEQEVCMATVVGSPRSSSFI